MEFAVERGDAVEISVGQRNRRQFAGSNRPARFGGRELGRVHLGASGLRVDEDVRRSAARSRGRRMLRFTRSRKRVPWRNSSKRSAPIFRR